MSQNSGGKIENAGNVFAQINRLFLLALAVSFTVVGGVMIAPVDSGKFSEEARSELQGLDRLSTDVQRRLRSYLTVSAEPTDSAQAAIRRMLKNVRSVRRKLDMLGEALDKTLISDATRDLVENVRTDAEYHVNILNFDEVYSDLPQAPQGPSLRMSIVDHGNFVWKGGIDDRGIDELARLLFWASMYPDQINISISPDEHTGGLNVERLVEIQALLEKSKKRGENGYSKGSRSAAAALWGKIFEIDKDPSRFGGRLETVSPTTISEALSKTDRDRKLIEQHARGETEISAPYLQQQLTVGRAITFATYLVSTLNLLISISLWRMGVITRSLSADKLIAAEMRLPFLAAPGDQSRVSVIVRWLQVALLLMPVCLFATGFFVVSPPVWNWYLLTALLISTAVLLLAVYVFDIRWSQAK